MNRLLSLALLAGGITLIVVGISATNSFNSDVSRFFTGSPTDKAVWMLIVGCICALVGLVSAMRAPRRD
jgi:divalent metal cation (Fe/Co/Zn/Cd) transporter